MSSNHPVPAAGRAPVLHVINGEHYSGAERVQDLLARRLPESGFDVTFACVKPGQFARMRQFPHAPIHDLPMRVRIDVRPARKLVAIARQTGTVLLHAHTPRSLIVARLAAMLGGLPLIYHVHSPTARDTTRPLRNWLNNVTERFSLTGVDRLITVSQSLADHMQGQGIAPERIVTVPNGVPGPHSLPARETPTDTWVLGTVALFRPRKGLEILLESLARLRSTDRPLRLRAVGQFESATYEASIRRLADTLGVSDAIDWVGFTQDVRRELAQIDLFVLPSLFGEGLPMVILEAMAEGVPVVATNVQGVPEAIRDGRDGVLARAGDPEDLTRAICTVVDDPAGWQRLRSRAFERHARQFSDSRMARQVADVYRTVLQERQVQACARQVRPSRRS